jgi:hypothetical protein
MNFSLCITLCIQYCSMQYPIVCLRELGNYFHSKYMRRGTLSLSICDMVRTTLPPEREPPIPTAWVGSRGTLLVLQP